MDKYLKKQSPNLQTIFFKCCYLQNISKCTSLRALHIPRTSLQFIVWVKHLQHLRYLNLSENLCLRALPEDISLLYHLQTLDLTRCLNLRQLSKDMKYMTSLRHLYTTGCKSLTCMPSGLSQITSLQTVTKFVVGASSSRCSTIGEIRSLNLGGELELSGLENATEAHAKEANLENKEKLTHLSLEWNDKSQEEPVQVHHKKVLYALEPHDGLQMLRIVNYKGTSLPSWISNLSLLTGLHLLGCVLCEEFPHFNHFKHLQILSLEKLEKLRSLCCDMASVTFLALKELMLHDLGSLERWVAVEGKEVMFPVLEKLHIKNCPKLTGLPEAPNLKGIKLDEGKAMLSLELVVKSRYILSLSKLELTISEIEDVTPPQIDHNHESCPLSELKLEGCHFFFSSKNPSQPTTFGVWKWFSNLVTLEISDCDTLLYWPNDVFQCLVLLKNLSISKCKKLIGRSQVRGGAPTPTAVQILPNLSWVYIWSCGSLEELFILPPSIRTIIITRCPRFEFIWGRQEEHHETYSTIQPEYLASTSIAEQPLSPTNRHPCLEILRVWECDNLAMLPNLPPSLKILMIMDCRKLCSVSGHLDALENLYISGCSKLQTLNSLGDLPSLEELFLESCQCLASLPGVLESYSALRELTVKYCPAIDMRPLYRRHRQRLDSIERKNISHAHSSAPLEGPKLREPRSWKYAIPGVSDWTERRHDRYY